MPMILLRRAAWLLLLALPAVAQAAPELLQVTDAFRLTAQVPKPGTLRLHWIIAPGRDFFVVFNHGIEASVTDPNARVQPISNEVIAKLSWDFRL